MNPYLSCFSRHVTAGLSAVVFPRVCLCCGMDTAERERHICSFCKEERFEEPCEEEGGGFGSILPEGILLRHALWRFDKGGLLQDLMHHLKYERLTGIGLELGMMLGESIKKRTGVHAHLDPARSLLLPVPLHYLRFRKRGFNQAFMVARGMQEVLGTPICGLKTVARGRYTRSQTGFSVDKRIANVRDAFQVREPERLEGKTVIIVDDVFTTGATVFELARSLRMAGTENCIIATVAEA